LYLLYGTQDVEGVDIVLDLAGGVGCFLADDVEGEGETGFKTGEAAAEERGDNEAGEDGSG
jgi:hypothetical protein